MAKINAEVDAGAFVDAEEAVQIEAIAKAIVSIFGDRAPDIARRQGDEATGAVRRSWIAILICVNHILAKAD
jgi:hypothetical protein